MKDLTAETLAKMVVGWWENNLGTKTYLDLERAITAALHAYAAERDAVREETSR